MTPAPQPPQADRLGIVIPAYKEADNIAPLIQAIRKELPEAEIVVVDDSPDESTKDAVLKLNDPFAMVVHRTTKGGRGSAVLEGIAILLKKGCTRIGEMDADFSHPPSQLPALIKEASDRNLDLLVASRYLPTSRIENWPLGRRVFSIASNHLARFMLGIPICDYTNGYRLYSRRAGERIVETCGKLGKGFIALSEILVNVYCSGLTVGETPTIFTNRLRGESSVNYHEIKNALLGLWGIYLLKKRLSAKP